MIQPRRQRKTYHVWPTSNCRIGDLLGGLRMDLGPANRFGNCSLELLFLVTGSDRHIRIWLLVFSPRTMIAITFTRKVSNMMEWCLFAICIQTSSSYLLWFSSRYHRLQLVKVNVHNIAQYIHENSIIINYVELHVIPIFQYQRGEGEHHSNTPYIIIYPLRLAEGRRATVCWDSAAKREPTQICCWMVCFCSSYIFFRMKKLGEKWMVGIFTDNWLNGYYFSIWKYLNKSPCWLINMSNHQAVDHQQFGSYISAAMFEVSLLRFAPRQEPYPKQTCQKLGMVELRFWIPGLFRSF